MMYANMIFMYIDKLRWVFIYDTYVGYDLYRWEYDVYVIKYIHGKIIYIHIYISIYI